MGSFWNEERLKNYPRLIFIGVWSVMLLNIILHHGWAGKFGGVIAVDFISNYTSGLQYRFDIRNLYSLSTQYEFQQQIFQQEEFVGHFSIFPSPPYVAYVYSLLTYLPFGYAFTLWTFLSILAGVLSLYLMEEFLIPEFTKRKLTFFQLFIIVFGFPPTVFGLMFGQNHLITFLLMVSILILSFRGRWLYSGILLGLLIYKPHLVIGFLIVFILRKRIMALIGFSIVVLALVCPVLLQYGFSPFIKYYEFTGVLLNMTSQNFMLETTTIALILSVANGRIKDFTQFMLPYLIMLISVLFGIIITSVKVQALRVTDYSLALLLPFIISPHILIYDILSFILIIIILAKERPLPSLINYSVYLYLSILICAALANFVKLSLLGFIPIFLTYLLLQNLVLSKKQLKLD